MGFQNPPSYPVKVLDEGIQIGMATEFDFTGNGVSGSALGSRVTEFIPASGGADDFLRLNQATPQSFTGGDVIGTGLLKVTAGLLGLDTSTYIEAGDIDWATNVPLNETDPVYSASSWFTTTNNANNWDTAYGWGNHADAGYLTTISGQSHSILADLDADDHEQYLNINGRLGGQIVDDNVQFNAIGINTAPSSTYKFNLKGQVAFVKTSMPVSSMTGALAGLGAGNVNNGTHRYRVTYVTAMGETRLSSAFTTVTVSNKTTNGQVLLSNIPISTDPEVTARRIYRTYANQTLVYNYLGEVSDNTTTTFLDNTADGSLGEAGQNRDNTTTGQFFVDSEFAGFIGVNNVGFGRLCLGHGAEILGYYNFALGTNSLYALTSGYQNSALGAFSLNKLTTGVNNTALGFNALSNLADGINAIGIGVNSLYLATDANGTIAIGHFAGYTPNGLVANACTTSTGCIFIGYQSGLGSATQRLKAMAFGYNATVDADNTLALGGVGVDAVNVAIGGTTASEKLHIYGGNVLMEDNYGPILGTGKDMKMFYDGTDGHLQTDLINPSDFHLDCGTNKTLVLDETVWDDLRVVPGSFDRVGVSDPTIVAYQPGGSGTTTYLYQFDKDNIASFTIQLPHNYKIGTNIYAHIHWNPGANGATENGNTVGWKLDYAWTNINGTFGTMTTLDLSDACDGVNHKHQMTSDVAITGANKNISSMLICNVKRTDTGADDTWTGSISGQRPMLLEIDFHYEIDTVGSREIGSK